jgi:hypothetical protein
VQLPPLSHYLYSENTLIRGGAYTYIGLTIVCNSPIHPLPALLIPNHYLPLLRHIARSCSLAPAIPLSGAGCLPQAAQILQPTKRHGGMRG